MSSNATMAAASTTILGRPGELLRPLEKPFDTAREDNMSGVDLTSYLQDIAFASNHLVKHRIDKEAQ
jgi:hypothetical protein